MSTATLTEHRSLRFFVPGLPKTAGSKRAIRHKHTGKIIVIDACKKGKAWKDRIAGIASEALGGPLLDGPLMLRFVFVFPRPKDHFGTGKNARRLKPSAPEFHTSKPDATKCLRACEDAYNGTLWKDDSQIVQQAVSKIYGNRPGVHIHVWTADEPIAEPEVIRLAGGEE